MRLRAAARGGGAAGRDHLLALRLLPARQPRATPRTAATSCSRRCTSRACSPTRSTRPPRPTPLPGPVRHREARRSTRSPPTSPPGCASRSSTSTAPAGPSAAGSTSTPRSTSTCRRRSRAIAYDTLAGIEPTASVVVHRQRDRRRQGDGRRQRLREGALQPGDQRPPPAGLVVQAVHPGRRRSRTGISPGDVYELARRRSSPSRTPAARRSSRSTTTRTTTRQRSTSTTATIYSDNSVYAELGLGERRGPQGPEKVADDRPRTWASRPTSRRQPRHDPRARIDPGVTPLEMAYAYRRSPRDGERISGKLDTIPGANDDPRDLGPVAISKIVERRRRDDRREQDRRTMRVLDRGRRRRARRRSCAAASAPGTGEHAQTGGDDWGKTGTTENNGDAWFCGGTDHFTACVWVGHAQTNTPMETEYGGEPVDGGTFPAQIWARSCRRRGHLREQHEAERRERRRRRLRRRHQQRRLRAAAPAPLRRERRRRLRRRRRRRRRRAGARALRRRRRRRRRHRRHRRHRRSRL